MKKFSKAWVKSKKIKKQRKYRYNAPLNIKHKFLSSHLSKELAKKYKERSLPLRKGDKVRIVRGEFKKKEGKILKTLSKKSKVHIENIQKTKTDGTKIHIPFDPSNLIIIDLDLTDKKRKEKLERKNG